MTDQTTNQPEYTRHWPLEGTYNVRDLGGYATKDGRLTRWRTVLRADALHKLSEAAQEELINGGLRTVIDLRHAVELERAPNVFANSERITYFNIPLLAGQDPTAVSSMPDNLPDLYRHILDNAGEQVKVVINAITPEGTDSTMPVLVHCTAGKDRTGVISALLLGVAGVPDEVIIEDYALTTQYLAPMFAELRAKMAEMMAQAQQQAAQDTGDTDGTHTTNGTHVVLPQGDASRYKNLMGSEPDYMAVTLAHLNERYGGAENYLLGIGVTPGQIEALRRALVG